MAMLAVLLQMLAAGNSQATPDSGAILRSARRAQAAFESTRTRSLPERPGGWSDICGQRIGRICYWYESDDDEDSAPPEPARIREARARLLAALREAGAALPGDEWIVGQRVRYLLEDSQPASAALVAAQCRAALWWCEVLAGLVRHATGDFAAADSTFATALADMPADERCRWGDLSPLLEGELAERYRRLDCDARAAFEARWWWLAQPLYSHAGNDRRTEHFARVVMVRIQEGRRTAPHAHLRSGHVVPPHRHFEDAITELLGNEQHFHVKAETVDCLQRKYCLDRFPREQLEAALRVFVGKPHERAHQEIEGPAAGLA